MNTSKPLVFFGTEQFSLTALTGLIENGYAVAAVVTKPNSKSGRGHKETIPPVRILAESHGIPVWQPQKLSDITEQLESLTDPIGVLVSYGKIIPERTINLFNPGIINVHPSLLPRYRGATPIESAIKNGDQKTGVSIMALSPKMDAGPIYAQVDFPLTGHEDRLELSHALADVGTNLLLESLPKIIDSSLAAIPQDEAMASYTTLLRPSDALLDPSALTAIQAERLVRAHRGYPKTKATIGSNTIVITKAHISDTQKTPLDLLCQDGAYLSIDELVAPSGRSMNASAFLNGYAA